VGDLDNCKRCGHSIDAHKGTAKICMKPIGEDPTVLCDCCHFDEGKPYESPIKQGWRLDVS
jgi:hypothetical protein